MTCDIINKLVSTKSREKYVTKYLSLYLLVPGSKCTAGVTDYLFLFVFYFAGTAAYCKFMRAVRLNQTIKLWDAKPKQS